ncbi:four helix bundle protein [Clostridium beijerinckii]|uniref:Four helix bundle protein n=1 Tax=Clostridium beijerinckii TaxID=1520 RepID=A0AAW3W2T9_CLOBE|nr:four helix bundle protein [Clostridium beijerinckii]MBC2455642.1 four helix bundle protein [Clostridium beijerinckii]MBC2473119.1 four helix bundle protein [Clostridium beijerinckii]NOV62377.1 four helix bundle protein [Clostridium beijerinckii]NOV68126.1 four helix bundle protein [Clostridium beijerinckii]NOW30429.1 four helix bundle protein [Clostridium beijerinckii]
MKTVNIKEKLEIKAVELRLNELQDFRELIGYKRGLEFYTKLYVILSRLPFYEQYGVFDQCDRSSMSILANLSEGVQSLYPKTTINFYSIALATANETQCWLDIMLLKGYLTSEQHLELDGLLQEIKKLVICYIKKLVEDIES